MIYVILALSIILNGVLVWYVRELLAKLWIDTEVREKFTEMIGQYRESLEAIYRLEELYGEEVLKKAIYQTRFVEEACQEFETLLKTKGEIENQEDNQEDDEDTVEKDNEEKVIRLKEGESISQDADKYKRVVTDI